jgi:large subunit ribosomal protein L7/L12
MSEEKNVVVPEKFKSLVEQIEKLSALDLSELVKILEEKFGVSGSAPMMMAAAPAAGAAAAEEQSSFNVEMTNAGANKIAVIKVIREVTQKGLKEAKDMTDVVPQMIKEGVGKAEAEELKKKFEAAGAQIVLK